MTEPNGGPHRSGQVLAVTLTVPEPWARAIVAAARVLCDEFDGIPAMPFEPHISLCQSFTPGSSLHAVATAVGCAIGDLPAAFIRVGGVRTFNEDGADPAPEVVYVAAEAGWLFNANHRLVLATDPHRRTDVPSPGNPAFDLAGYTPHITLVFTRDLPRNPRLRHAVAERAAVLWQATRPAGDGFWADDIVLSAVECDEERIAAPVPPLPSTIRRWCLAHADEPQRLGASPVRTDGHVGLQNAASPT